MYKVGEEVYFWRILDNRLNIITTEQIHLVKEQIIEVNDSIIKTVYGGCYSTQIAGRTREEAVTNLIKHLCKFGNLEFSDKEEKKEVNNGIDTVKFHAHPVTNSRIVNSLKTLGVKTVEDFMHYDFSRASIYGVKILIEKQDALKKEQTQQSHQNTL